MTHPEATTPPPTNAIPRQRQPLADVCRRYADQSGDQGYPEFAAQLWVLADDIAALEARTLSQSDVLDAITEGVRKAFDVLWESQITNAITDGVREAMQR
jgi:hypothetical protein